MDRPKISVCGFEIEWDLERGLNLWAGTPALSMWIPTTVAGLMSGLQRMVGTERFNLCLQQGGIDSVEGDWSVISSQPTFEEGMEVMSGVASSAGWGRWQVISIDREKKEARLRTVNSWEGIYQRALGVCWGSGMMAGKFAGICTRLFGTQCWAEQTAFSAVGGDFDEFLVKPTDTTIEQRLEKLLSAGQATSADLAVALTKLREQIRERERTEEELRGSLEVVRRQEEAMRTMAMPIIQVWDGILTVPMMGTLDSTRTAAMQERLLQEVVNTRARYALLDLTAIESVDTNSASYLVRMVRAVELIGARAIITGIHPLVAQAMVSLGIDLSRILTLRNLQEGLRWCLREMGTRMTQAATTGDRAPREPREPYEPDDIDG